MTVEPELLLAFIAVAAAIVTSLVALYKWADDQDRAKHEQLGRQVSSEIRAEFYRHLLELNVAWLSSNPQQRETLTRLTNEANNQLQESQDTSHS